MRRLDKGRIKSSPIERSFQKEKGKPKFEKGSNKRPGHWKTQLMFNNLFY